MQCASFALGNASAALTGETLGQREPELAYENTKKYMKIQWLLNGIMTVMILVLRRPIAMIYDFDAETTEMLMLSLGVFAFTLIRVWWPMLSSAVFFAPEEIRCSV